MIDFEAIIKHELCLLKMYKKHTELDNRNNQRSTHHKIWSYVL